MEILCWTLIIVGAFASGWITSALISNRLVSLTMSMICSGSYAALIYMAFHSGV